MTCRIRQSLYVLIGLLIAVVALLAMTALGGPHTATVHAAPPANAALTSPTAMGAIAYLYNNSTEIRLVEADGTNDRLLWRAPNPELHRIGNVAWSPDGTRLAFSSDHETVCSLFRSDLYTIKPDGTDLQRVTNAPACSELATYSKGSVTIDVENQLTESIYFIYVEGAPEAQEVIINPATKKRIIIANVADFGDGVQQRVVIFQTEQNSWIYPTAVVDVLPNAMATAGDFTISNSNKFSFYGAYSPSWRRDSQAIGFALGAVSAYQVAANPGIGAHGEALFSEGSHFATSVALSPLDDRVLLFSYPYMSLGTVGNSESVARVVEFSGDLYGVDWLADGSGLVAGEVAGFETKYANLFTYTYGESNVQHLTNYESEFAADPSVSPDGTELVFIYAPTIDADAELQIMNIDGSNVRSLGVKGIHPDWGMPSQAAQPTPTPTVMPTVTPTSTGTPQATVTPTATRDPAPATDAVYLPYVQQ
ncbi:MAG: hypothetical protein R3C14_41160 [Caldilineaceae bacterium]